MTEINYIHRGGTGTPIVFLHGWGGDRHSLDALALRVREPSYSLDLYGFGKTPLDAPMTVDEYADGVAAWIDGVVGRSVIVVGHSFGGRVAISLAARHGALVDGVVLICSAGVKPRRGARYFLRKARHKLLRLVGRDTASCGSPDYRNSSGALRKTMVAAVNFFQESQIEQILAPVLVVYGKSDRETPPYIARRICRRLRDGALVAVDGGHFCYLRNAALLAAALDAFARGIKCR